MKRMGNGLLGTVALCIVATAAQASDKTIWGEQMVVNSAQSPASKGEGSGSPMASRRPAKNKGLASKRPSRNGRHAARRGDKVTKVKTTKSSKPATKAHNKLGKSVPSSMGGLPIFVSVTTQAELDTLVAQGKPLFVKVTIKGCEPCKAMQPIIDRLAQEMGKDVTFVAADATKKSFPGVSSYPTFIGFKGGNEQFRLIGENEFNHLRKEISTLLK